MQGGTFGRRGRTRFRRGVSRAPSRLTSEAARW